MFIKLLVQSIDYYKTEKCELAKETCKEAEAKAVTDLQKEKCNKVFNYMTQNHDLIQLEGSQYSFVSSLFEYAKQHPANITAFIALQHFSENPQINSSSFTVPLDNNDWQALVNQFEPQSSEMPLPEPLLKPTVDSDSSDEESDSDEEHFNEFCRSHKSETNLLTEDGAYKCYLEHTFTRLSVENLVIDAESRLQEVAS